MNRPLIRSNAFIRGAKRLRKNNSQAVQSLRAALVQMQQDVFHPQLKTHKLKGDLEGSWACSFGYDLRIVFQFVRHEGQEAILLESLGTHDQVY
jgi:addiction module RelE/StbE family toxin